MTHELGTGTFATVKKGVKRDGGGLFAIKFINSKALRGQHGSRTSVATAQKQDPVEREITVLGSLAHPNVCGLKEVFLDAVGNWCACRRSSIRVALKLMLTMQASFWSILPGVTCSTTS